MRLQYLGTAAAEGIPAIFCTCKKCRQARMLGGKNIRTRSQAIIDGKLLIDCPPDTLWHGITYNIDFSKINTMLITHVHRDHFYPLEFDNRRRGMSDLTGAEVLTVYGSEDLIEQVREFTQLEAPYGIQFCAVPVCRPFKTKDGYQVTALKAEHGTRNPYIYLIQSCGKTMLYGHDTGIFPKETYEYLIDNNIKMDMVSLDCTEGTKDITYSAHMNVKRCVELIARMKKDGIINENTIVCLNHFSHNGENCLYEEMRAICEQYGFIVSYDGMIVEF